jgi:hypothetical protein
MDDLYNKIVDGLLTVDKDGKVDIRKVQELKESSIPKKLFKYRSCTKLNIENFENNRLWLSFPENFNDPYDSSFSIAIASNELEEDLLDFFFRDKIKKIMKICCFSNSIESMLMWTHYSDEHKGFAVEYNLHQITEIKQSLWPVFYSDKLFDFLPLLSQKPRSNLGPLVAALHQSTDWEYEAEWRFISLNARQDFISLPIPKAIYLGSRICSADENALINIAKHKNIKVYKMKHDRKTFKMNYELVEDK